MSDDEDFEFSYSSPLMESAASMHELYVTLKEAGFSRRDALELIAKIMIGAMSDMAAQVDDEEDEEG